LYVQGNKYFKEGKYVQAIDCYSRSIALQPTAVAFANRAMALLKIRRYADAEVDCTEAIELDDHYTKAYSRRGTARKELKKYLASVEDFEFALRLEPENKELRKQYLEAKETYEKVSFPLCSLSQSVFVFVHVWFDDSTRTFMTVA
jgi:tetratricopeptide (TPR) repeat protein